MSRFKPIIVGTAIALMPFYLFGCDRPSTPGSEPVDINREQIPAKYHKLRDLLKAREWKEADEETALLMLQVVGREEDGWFRSEDLKNFPCSDLRAIDKLWVKYSNGRFGFSVQKPIWLEEGGQVTWETELRLADRVGWRVKEEWPAYENLTFDLTAPRGHLPAQVGLIRPRARVQWRVGGGGISSRAHICKL